MCFSLLIISYFFLFFAEKNKKNNQNPFQSLWYIYIDPLHHFWGVPAKVQKIMVNCRLLKHEIKGQNNIPPPCIKCLQQHKK